MITARNCAARLASTLIGESGRLSSRISDTLDGIPNIPDFYKSLTEPPRHIVKKQLELATALGRNITHANHFVLPDGGFVIKDAEFKNIEGVIPRLPYPIITLEYTAEPGVEVVILAREMVVDGMECIRIVPFSFSSDNQTWVMPQAVVSVHSEEHRVEGRYHMRTHNTPLYEFLLNAGKVKKFNMDHLTHALVIVMSFINALACPNVVTNTYPEANSGEDPQQHTTRRSKTTYETKYLTVLVPGNERQDPKSYGTGSPKREHLRRGHIRKLHNGKAVWVNACVVAAGNERVDKQYRIKPNRNFNQKASTL